MRRALLLALLALFAIPSAAQASFPGENGKIAFARYPSPGANPCIYTVNPDGTGVAPLFSCTSSQWGQTPRWSADGNWVALEGWIDQVDLVRADGTNYTPFYFDSGGSTDGFTFAPDSGTSPYVVAWDAYENNGGFGGYTMALQRNTGAYVLFGHDTFYFSPDWSPDGNRIAFAATDPCCDQRIFVVNLDGTGLHPVTSTTDGRYNSDPSWSPDGQRIVFTKGRPDGFEGDAEIYVMNADGSGQTPLTTNSAADTKPRWSPDGKKIVFQSDRDGPVGIYVMDANGSNQVQLVSDAFEPDWQPILRSYPRPKGAGTLHAPLVPAYAPCTSPDRVHSPPLSYNSCSSPTHMSTQLTLGTPDANGKAANSIASLRIGVIPGNPGTPTDEAEANLITSITDVRNASDLSDYTGNLEMRVPLQITDKSNTPYPGGPGPGTVQSFTFTWSVPCSATADVNIGSNCSLFTTADTLLPGSALETRRAIWETDRIEVRDGNGDPFLRQGIFVP